MKEATGELNMTVVIVTLVGVLSAFFFTVLWPMLENNFNSETNCAKAICAPCSDGTNTCEVRTCHVSGESETFECVNKG